MKKHPACEDRCQLLEHKGYHTCSQTGRCEQLEAMTARSRGRATTRKLERRVVLPVDGVPLVPSQKMIDAGAQRLVRWETGREKWPGSWGGLAVAAARNDAERVWRSMWLECRLEIERAALRRAKKRRGK